MENPTNDSGARPQPVMDEWRAAYQQKLAEAIAVLTDAARLEWPQIQLTDDGDWIDSLMGEREQADWAEFVTLALAGAAANYGGVDAILAGRSGSWEAAGVRQLLHSTVAPDEERLWEHRTEPLDITVYVEELLLDRTDALTEYDDAAQEIARRYRQAEDQEPAIDESQYLWIYDRDATGQWTPRDPDAPAWTLGAWRADLQAEGISADIAAELEQGLLESATSIYLAKSPEQRAELWALEEAREERLGGDLEERLEQQRLAEWTAYGEALKTRIEAAAAAIPGLTVPITVSIDVTTMRPPTQPGDNSLAERLIDDAAQDTPTPVDLPGTPLQRLEQS